MSKIIKTNNAICKSCKYNYGDLGSVENMRGITMDNARRAKTIGCAYLLDTGKRRVSDAVKAKVPQEEWWAYCDRYESKQSKRNNKLMLDSNGNVDRSWTGSASKSSNRRFSEV